MQSVQFCHRRDGYTFCSTVIVDMSRRLHQPLRWCIFLLAKLAGGGIYFFTELSYTGLRFLIR